MTVTPHIDRPGLTDTEGHFSVPDSGYPPQVLAVGARGYADALVHTETPPSNVDGTKPVRERSDFFYAFLSMDRTGSR